MKIDTAPLFDLDTRPAVRAPTSTPQSATRPTWTPYLPHKPEHCAHCLIVAHENGGGSINRARWRRKDENGALLLCSSHAQDQRERDALAFPERKR